MTVQEEMEEVCLCAQGVERSADSLKQYSIDTFGGYSKMTGYLKKLSEDVAHLRSTAETLQSTVDKLTEVEAK